MPTAAKGDQKLYEQHVGIFRDSKDGNERRMPTAAKGDHKLCGSPQHVGISKTVIIRTHDLQCFVVLLFHFPVTFYRTRGRPCASCCFECNTNRLTNLSRSVTMLV